MSTRNESSRVRRLRALQAAIREDWRAAQINGEAALETVAEQITKTSLAAAVSTHLLRFYAALERMLQRIAQEFDGATPSGDAWHREKT